MRTSFIWQLIFWSCFYFLKQVLGLGYASVVFFQMFSSKKILFTVGEMYSNLCFVYATRSPKLCEGWQ